MIDYSKDLKKIFVLKDWSITTFGISLNVITKIKLNHKFTLNQKITYFKYDNQENHFEIICTDSKQVRSYQFDLIGNIISQQILSENQNQILLRLTYDNSIDVIFINDNFSYEAKCKVYKQNKEVLSINLHDELEKSDKDWDYEYVESIVSTNQKNQFSFISVHANYGVQGIKIYEINSTEMNFIYDMDNLVYKGAFHHLSFDKTGQKFIVLLYERDKNYQDYFCICEYSISDNKKPIKIHKTEYGYWNFGQLYTQYLNESMLCIVRNLDIILFDLVKGKTKEILKRDLNSDYFVSFNILLYHLEGKIIILEF